MLETITLSFIENRKFPFYVEKKELKEGFFEHFHDFTEINVIVRGTAQHLINGESQPAKPGDVFVLNPGISHGFRHAKNLALYQVMYHPRHLSTHLSPLKKLSGYQALFIVEPAQETAQNFRGFTSLTTRELEAVTAMFEKMIKEYEHKMEGYETYLQTELIQLVLYLSRQYSGIKRENPGILYRVASTAAFIEKNYLTDLTLEQLAQHAGISVWQLTRDFKKHYGTTPINYVLHLRMEHAMRLLRNKKHTITEVAYSSGFSDSNYFARIFRQYTGMSPSQYRK